MDNYSSNCLGIHIDKSIKGDQVVEVMEALKCGMVGKPKKVLVDNGSEFISIALNKWAL
ncbi:hypothetical protein GCM10023188_34750 [Pontibacter saemangeumensis]|uniref:Integrase catalytic domain-containing protein n=1 Tax=Pontibacter saemangeumensis TaxID=1084525 RepID=A0ABP8LZS5_9BACT